MHLMARLAPPPEITYTKHNKTITFTHFDFHFNLSTD